MIVSVLVAIFGYSGPEKESYSMINHFISELGHNKHSPTAPVFNNGLIASSLLLTLFGWGFGQTFSGWSRYVVLLLGLGAGIFCGLVGIFPVGNLQTHIFVAMAFFQTALVLVFFCTGLTFFSKMSPLPKWTVIPGIITGLIFGAFILSPTDLVRAWIKDPESFVRPIYWEQCMLEWACFFSIIGWILMVAVLTIRRTKTMQAA